MITEILENKMIEKKFEEYIIHFTYEIESINISIFKENSYFSYKSNFNIEYLHKFKLLNSSSNVKEITKTFCRLIDHKNIIIEENKKYLKLILVSSLINYPNIELILNKNNEIPTECIEKLFKEIQKLKNENESLKESYENLINKFELFEKEKKEENDRIKEKSEDMEKRIKVLEEKEDKKKFDPRNFTLKYKNTNHPHNHSINAMSNFPSGNIISVSGDKSINIYDIHFNIIQHIEKAHSHYITYVQIKDEDNFITCSYDKNIKLWIKKENKFIENIIIENAHDDEINKVIYSSNGNLISCSQDNSIKIWKEKNNKYERIKTLKHSDYVESILLLEDKNILISSGGDGTIFWNLNKDEMNDINCVYHIQETNCGWYGVLCRLSEDRIIVNGKETTSLIVISISKKKKILIIDNHFQCNSIYLIEDKKIFLVGGMSKNIRVYSNDNYECIQTIENAHNDFIKGFTQLNNGSITSFSNDGIIKIWIF